MRVWGRAVILGDYIDTDRIIPGRYLHRSDPEWLRTHLFEDLPQACRKMQQTKPPIAIIAGEGFGMGSSREHAVLALKAAGVSLIIARSFYRIFYRNAIANALPVIEASLDAKDGDLVEAELEKGVIRVNGKQAAVFKPYPATIMEIIEAGGVLAYLKRLAARH